jgi:hypothetical protein
MYLRSCLTQEAADSIASLANTASNYSVAWEILETRYNRPTKIVDNHLKALSDTSPLQRPLYQDIRSYLNKIETRYKALQALKQPTVDTVLLYLFTSKLDPATEFRWKERIDHTSFPLVGDLFKFLHTQCRLLEPTKSSHQPPPRPTTCRFRSRVRSQDSRRTPTTNRTFVTQPQTTCDFCNGAHTSQNCKTFLSMSVPERSRLVRERNLCFNCLRNTHSTDECRAGNCMLCSK